jgi:hypothetical protein
LMISDNVEFLPPIFYAMFWQPFWKCQTSWKFWQRRIAKFLPVAIFEIATTILQKFNIVRYHQNLICG